MYSSPFIHALFTSLSTKLQIWSNRVKISRFSYFKGTKLNVRRKSSVTRHLGILQTDTWKYKVIFYFQTAQVQWNLKLLTSWDLQILHTLVGQVISKDADNERRGTVWKYQHERRYRNWYLLDIIPINKKYSLAFIISTTFSPQTGALASNPAWPLNSAPQ